MSDPHALERVPFTVVECSSREDGYDEHSLEPIVQNSSQPTSSTTKGWISARFCEYPQHLTLRFTGR